MPGAEQPIDVVDVDLTLFIPPDRPGELVRILRDCGCAVSVSYSTGLIEEHGSCRANYAGFRIVVFLPMNAFYEIARHRRRHVDLEGQPVMIWDAETLAVFKMMFFREKDFVDIRQMMKTQGTNFDKEWVRGQLESIFGRRDPRTTTWHELTG